MIEAHDISYRVGTSVLVRGVSLAVNAGEIVALVGPNGAGKSTLLRVLAGDLAPSSGEVRIAGRPLSSWERIELARARAVLAQSSELAFPFSAGDVVMLGRSPHVRGTETLHDRVVVELAMSTTDTRAYLDRLYPTLSGGEKQRVQAARTLAQVWDDAGPRALFLDEPTASLDLAHQHALLRVARRMAEDGCAVLCVLHDLNLASQYADRIAVLHRGALRACARPAHVLTPSLLADVFGVSAVVIPHPEFSCPLVVALGSSEGPTDRVVPREVADEA